jgi:CheY-like chemotaxis protein
MNKTRIMIVDDEAPFTRLLKLNLERTGDYEVQVENNPQAAYKSASHFLPDLILMDVMMPGIDGGTLAATFHASTSFQNVPIVFLTAAVKREEVEAHHGMIGGLPFLAKPVDLAELTQCLQQQLHA